MSDSDARTVRLAHPEITIEELDVFMTAVNGDGHLDRAKLDAAGMKLEKAHRIQAAVAAFLRPKRAHERLSLRLEVARKTVEAALARNEAAPAKDSQLAESIPPRLRELAADQSIAEFYSAATIDALRAREAKLLHLPRPV